VRVLRPLLGKGIATAVLAAALLVTSVAPAGAEQSDFALTFGSRSSGTATAMRLFIVYRKPSDPNGKPSEIRHLVVHAPTGTVFDVHAVPACTASNEQLQAQGRSACPASSQIGSGTLTVMSGFGPPFDPIVTDATIYNNGGGFSEIAQYHGTSVTLGVDRLSVQGSTLTGNPPTEPGGPPDGQSAVREIDFRFTQATHWVITPPQCPASGLWTSTAAFTFADGTTQHVASSTPCDRSAAQTPAGNSRGGKAHHRKRHRKHRRRHRAARTHRRDPDHDGDRD
jgi:hypothetical protein